jgi:TetR/AcrR family transcriptional repressor of nem operon
MRISKAQVKEHRELVIGAASELFRAKGFDAVAVADLMRAAGFTHGGFYNHFRSKEALAAEALQSAWSQMAKERARARDLPEMLKSYLSQAARQAPGKTCPAAALAGDVGRQPDAVKAVFADGLKDMIQSIEEGLPADKVSARERAISLVTRMVGALMLSRAVPDDSPLADELLRSTLRGALRESRAVR